VGARTADAPRTEVDIFALPPPSRAFKLIPAENAGELIAARNEAKVI
jgi:electron transfer flavoprotein beta subunit